MWVLFFHYVMGNHEFFQVLEKKKRTFEMLQCRYETSLNLIVYG